jgi:hypothetical protein
VTPGAAARRRLAGVLLAVAMAGPAAAQDTPHDLARELARLMLDSTARRSIEEPLIASMVQGVAGALQTRLNRRLLEAEWQMVAEIVRRFIAQTLGPERSEAIAADVYVRHFDADELRALLAFQRSPVGRKTAQLAPVVAAETAQAMDRAIRTSAALPEMLAELRQAFPVLGTSESP